MSIQVRASGKLENYMLKFYKKDQVISPWHDIALYKNKKKDILNFICEIPKWTRKKMEITTDLENNPIKQDIKNGQLREYKWGDMMFNYGAFPQTWENPHIFDKFIKKKGDGDPLDGIEIGSKQLKCGEIVGVKVIGILALIDEDETDWKVIVINNKDLLAEKINGLKSLEKYLPGIQEAIKIWFVNYKIAEGGTKNKLGFSGEIKDKRFAKKVIQETNKEWKIFYQNNKKIE